MNLTDKTIYELLPAIYRIRDEAKGLPLKSLIDLIAREAGILEDDINRLYENWFIETCDEWVVPYIGDLLKVRGLHSVKSISDFSIRAYVANTLSYRRRKGTAPVLEQLALDTTGWRSHVVEFFNLLSTTQNINHIRLQNVRTPDLRNTQQLELINTAFETATHTADVRRINEENGWYNIPNIGLFLWRLQSYPMSKSTARKINSGSSEGFAFSPLGNNMHLFNSPQSEKQITHLAEEKNVPGLLRYLPLYNELEKYRYHLAFPDSNETVDNKIYFGDSPVLRVWLDSIEIPKSEILICNLSDWKTPPGEKIYTDFKGNEVSKTISVAVDPVLGRLKFPSGMTPEKVQVSYSYGFGGDVGGGSYDRMESVSLWYNPEVPRINWQIGVTKDSEIIAEAQQPELLVESIQEAISEWNTYSSNNPGTFGVITILDNDTYEENLTSDKKIEISPGNTLAIVAADWPQKEVTDSPGILRRSVGDFVPTGLRPHILGNVSVKGLAPDEDENGGRLILDGPVVEGKLTVLSGNLGNLTLSNCTLVPNHNTSIGALTVNTKNTKLQIELESSICEKIDLESPVLQLVVRNSIIDAGEGEAITAVETDVVLRMSTILGKVDVKTLEAENSIITGICSVARTQAGCVRFSFIPYGSRVPRRHKCQPDFALKARAEELGLNSLADLSNKERLHIIGILKPSFASVIYGNESYCKLGIDCPEEILTGSEDGAEMGVFNFLKQTQRRTNLQTALDEYLNLGLSAGTIFVT